jgi:hypothetical protein
MRSAAVLALLLWALPAAAQDDAYRDPRARELVRLARARRAVVDTRITGYQVTARDRVSARMSVMGIEKLLFRRETASRIDWSRDTVRVEVLGAREAIPALRAEGQRISPDNIAGMAMAVAFDPADPEMLLRFDSTVIRNPLAAGSEAHYRYSSGDSLSIRLPNGRGVRILELRIAARRADPHLINGSFWLDSETHAVVRAGFRQSRPFSSVKPGVTVAIPEAGAELDYVAIDYGLWDRRWWLPRSVAARGVAHFSGRRFPLSYERTYEGYRVTGDTLAAAPTRQSAPEGVAATPPRCRRRVRGSITIGIGTSTPSDSSWEAAWDREVARMAAGDTAKSDSAAADSAGAPQCTQTFVVTRAPAAELVSGPAFPAGIYDEKEGAVSEQELRTLADLVRDLPTTPWSIGRPGVRLLSTDMIRFNRVEGLSLGARASLPLGPAELRGELRAGTTGEIGARLGGIYSTAALRTEVAAYRGLEAVAVASQPFTLASSASALLLGRDENDYFRATGAELRLSPAATRRQRWDARVFAEHQRGVRARSDVSLRGAFDDGFDARENVLAETLDQAGATLRLRASRGDDPAASAPAPSWSSTARRAAPPLGARSCAWARRGRSRRAWATGCRWRGARASARCRCSASGRSGAPPPCAATTPPPCAARRSGSPARAHTRRAHDAPLPLWRRRLGRRRRRPVGRASAAWRGPGRVAPRQPGARGPGAGPRRRRLPPAPSDGWGDLRGGVSELAATTAQSPPARTRFGWILPWPRLDIFGIARIS